MDTIDLAPLKHASDLLEPDIRVIAQPSLFREPGMRNTLRVPYGATLLELVLETGMGELQDGVVQLPGKVVVTIDGEPIDRAVWHRVRPRTGRLVNIFVVPQDSRTAIYIGVALAIGVAAIATGGLLVPALAATSLGMVGAGLVGGVVMAGIAVAGQYAMTALIPVEKDNQDTHKPPSSVTDQSNRMEPNMFVPIILGTMRIFPVCYARFYTEKAGSDTWLRALYCVGQGPLEIDNLKADGVDFSELSLDIDVQIREGRTSDPPITLYPDLVTEVNPSATLGEIRRGDDANPISHILTSAENTDEITIDLKWPGGIVANRESGKRDRYHVEYDLAIRVNGTTTWFDFENGNPELQKHTEEHETSNLIYRTHRRRDLAPGEYDVRLRRRTGDNDPGDSNVGNFFWTALRSFRKGDPRPDKTIACIAIRVKRANTTTVPQISCRARSYALDWNGTTWTEQLTRNPASLARLLLQSRGHNPNPIPDSRLDLPSWQAFHEHCDDEAFLFDGVFEDESTARERISVVLAAGRGRLIPPDTKYAIAIDRNGKLMSGMITPRNSSGFSGRHILRRPLHALRVQFLNFENDYALDERVVYADGFDAASAKDGHIEIYDLSRAGITSSDRAWRHGRYRLADYALRLDTYSVRQGFESLQVVPGDLVGFQHDVPLLGLGRGRITSIVLNGSSQVTSCTIDDEVTMEAGKTYEARIRLIADDDTDQYLSRAVTTVVGTTKTLSFSTPFPATQSPQIGALLAFGETGLATVRCIVKDVLPADDNGAEVILIDEAPGVNNADTGPIPPYDPHITTPGDFFGTPPAVPVIDDIKVENIGLPSQPDIITTQQIVIHLKSLGGKKQPPTGYEVEIKRHDQPTYQRRYSFPADTAELTIPVLQSDVDYDVRVRANGRSPAGIPTVSAWSAVAEIYVPIPRKTLGTTARVTGLELHGQGSNTTFSGPDAHFSWRLTATTGAAIVGGTGNGLVAFAAPEFSYYEVVVIDPATGFERRKELVGIPEYIYSFGKNKEDSLRQTASPTGGSHRPLRRFRLRVTFVDKFSKHGPPQFLTVRNPAPPEPTGLLISGAQGSLLVKANIPDDADWEKMKVYIATSSGFDPDASTTQVEEVASNVGTFTDGITAATGTNLFVRVALADRFSDQHTDLNLSNEFQVVIQPPSGPPVFEPSASIRFTSQRNSNVVRWTAGNIVIFHGGSVTIEAIAAGSATWSTGILWLYYVRGTGVIQATTNAGLSQGDDRRLLAHYRGKNLLSRAGGAFPVTNSSSAKAGQESIGRNIWQNVSEPEDLETAGNPVTIIFACDVSNASAVAPVGGGGAVIEGQARLLRNGNVLRTWTLSRDSATAGQTPITLSANTMEGRAIMWIDEPAAGMWSYIIQMRVDVSGGLNDFDALVRCSACSIYETML